MDNSLVTHLKDYVSSLFRDLKETYTRLGDWERDQNRLFHELGAKGHSVLTLDLPALGKHFDRCLDEGQYVPSSLRYSRCVNRKIQVPCFARNLYLQVFNHEGKLLATPSIDAIVALRQLFLGMKKIRLECSSERVTDAVSDFISIEAAARSPSLYWDGDSMDTDAIHHHFGDDMVDTHGQLCFAFVEHPHGCSLGLARTLQQVADRVSASFGTFDFEGAGRPKHGPGVVANLKKGVSKYSFPDWSAKLARLFPPDLYGSHNLGVDVDLDLPERFRNREVPSRLITVPKTPKGPRLIAAEPVELQWMQQLVWSQLESKVRESVLRHCIDFRSQSRSQELALRASVDGSYATVDLSSASDRLTCWTVERAFRKNKFLLEALHATRVRWLENGVRPHLGRYHRLKKFSTMGSACTFPVQSIIYSYVAIASVLHSRGRRVSTRAMEEASRLVCVFGDDIIVPKDALESLRILLQYLGLKVNVDKTFGVGKFRESCGVDAYGGHDVTPAYITNLPAKVLPSNIGSLVEVSNNFHLKGWWRIADWLRSLTSDFENKIPIVNRSTGIPGHVSFCGESLVHLKRRWSASLQKYQFAVLRPYVRIETRDVPGTYRLFQWLHMEPSPEVNLDTRQPVRIVSDWRLGWLSLEDKHLCLPTS